MRNTLEGVCHAGHSGKIQEYRKELVNIYTESYSKLYACVFRMTGTIRIRRTYCRILS
jgi:hypothetical protein